jgi:antitoxin MazE
MKTTIQKWENSLALCIPGALAKNLHLHDGSAVEISVSDGKLILKPLRRRKHALAQLLKGITKDNQHPEIDWGALVGREIW